MATSYLSIPAGTTSASVFVTPLTNVIIGPSVLGGSVTLTFSPSLSIPVNQWQTVFTGTAGTSFRPLTTGYVQVQATTSAGNAFFADLGPGLQPGGGVIVSTTAPIASASTTSEVVLASWKVPDRYLSPNFQMKIEGSVSLTNSVNVKTLKIYANGVAGTAMLTSPSLASALNFQFIGFINGRGDGQNMIGIGMLPSQTSAQGGRGISTTAQPTITRDYLNQETEFAITVTKATGSETAQLEALKVSIS